MKLDLKEWIEKVLTGFENIGTLSTPTVELANGNIMSVAYNTSRYIEITKDTYIVFVAVAIRFSGARAQRLPLFRFSINGSYLNIIAPAMVTGQTENSTTSFNPVYWSDPWFYNPVAVSNGNMTVWANGVIMAQKAV